MTELEQVIAVLTMHQIALSQPHGWYCQCGPIFYDRSEAIAHQATKVVSTQLAWREENGPRFAQWGWYCRDHDDWYPTTKFCPVDGSTNGEPLFRVVLTEREREKHQ